MTDRERSERMRGAALLADLGNGIAHLILGSVAEEIVRTAPCPVLTLSPLVQEKAAQLRLQQSVDA